MGEFFHGWRRKTGCVTLVLAAILMAGWIRSFATFDFAEIHIGSGVFAQGFSAASSIGFGWKHGESTETVWLLPQMESSAAEESPEMCFNSWGWRVRFASFGFVYCAGDDYQFWAIPYCLLALPLTLLSAYLILWNSRKVK